MKTIHDFPANAEGVKALVERLRRPDGCPWDREQTLKSLIPSLTGECAEVVEAIERDDKGNLCEELGDLLMNCCFLAVLNEEEGTFTWEEVCVRLLDKMVRRHPHVFGNAHAEQSSDVLNLWQKIKAEERADESKIPSVYEHEIVSLSALERAEKIQKKAAKVGFDWADASGIVAKLQEELDELKAAFASQDEVNIDEELGDLLFTAANLARFRKRGSSDALLRGSCRKFVMRFQRMEELLYQQGKTVENCTTEELEQCYQAVKRRELTEKA